MVQGRFILLALLLSASLAVAAEPAAKDLVPEDTVPIPEARPDTAPATPPIPQEKPAGKAAPPPDETKPASPADTKPTEPAKEQTPKEETKPGPDGKDAPAPTETKAEPPEKEDPEAYAACLADLKQAGVDFSEARPIDDGNGCGIDKPLTVRTVLPGIKLEPEATMRCQTALALSRWAKASVLPAADIAYGPNAAQITAFNQATSYACRNRNNAESGKISEHAHGNAIDIAGFRFSDGKTVVIEPREKDATLVGAFERAITASACLFFTTVLGPGSDAAHETHLHLDLIKRKNEYRYCW
ncbi:extensin-like domain-containing protein [Rhizobium sp. C4]|uniref:extensin-like domain-containing protein n=1 Tax=Rhizobium sp. C4 TaxID=1349800 RepID=UPI001E5AE54E|nr:extensin family protein [Rhizobium sp. C4]MCD2173895.1 extensin family protein [Rhizobium sp. C4]